MTWWSENWALLLIRICLSSTTANTYTWKKTSLSFPSLSFVVFMFSFTLVRATWLTSSSFSYPISSKVVNKPFCVWLLFLFNSGHIRGKFRASLYLTAISKSADVRLHSAAHLPLVYSKLSNWKTIMRIHLVLTAQHGLALHIISFSKKSNFIISWDKSSE